MTNFSKYLLSSLRLRQRHPLGPPRVRALCAATLGLIAALLAAALAEGAALAAEGATESPAAEAPAAETPAAEAPAAEAPAAEAPAAEAPAAEAPAAEAPESPTPAADAPANSAVAAPAAEAAPKEDKTRVPEKSAKELSEEELEAQEEARQEAAERAEEEREQKECLEEQAARGGPSALVGDRCRRMKFGGYGGVVALGTRIDQKAALLLGIEGGILLDNRLAIGLAGYGLSTENAGPQFADGSDSNLVFGYGGVTARYQFVGKGPIYASAGVLVGGGIIALLERQSDGSLDFNDETKSANGFLVVEPSVQIHANLTHWLRIGLDASYRFAHGVSYYDYKEKDIRGFAAGGHVEFGWF